MQRLFKLRLILETQFYESLRTIPVEVFAINFWTPYQFSIAAWRQAFFRGNVSA